MKQEPAISKLEQPVTLRTLAAYLGLDPVTVSVVLNDVLGRAIPERTRQRIKEASRALGYSPNIFARALRTKKTRTIGIVIHDVADT
jgi:LacI family transcriptional regulator